jgi:putative acetyltransferase
MEIRKLKENEEHELWRLFHNTVHIVNVKDYSSAQVNAWAPNDINLEVPLHRIRENKPYVLLIDGIIIAFADLQKDGYIDQFFCHHEYIGKGVGTKLYANLEQVAKENGIQMLHANVSITARPFFERMGFSVLKEQVVTLNEQSFISYKMIKNLEKS